MKNVPSRRQLLVKVLMPSGDWLVLMCQQTPGFARVKKILAALKTLTYMENCSRLQPFSRQNVEEAVDMAVKLTSLAGFGHAFLLHPNGKISKT
jgi:hypothetical protein